MTLEFGQGNYVYNYSKNYKVAINRFIGLLATQNTK